MILLKFLNTHNKLLQIVGFKPETPIRKRFIASSILGIIISGVSFSNSTQAVTIAKLVDSSQFPNGLSLQGYLNGDIALFNASTPPALYSMNINTGASSLIKVLDSTTTIPIPQGAGNFNLGLLISAFHFVISNDKIVFQYNAGNQSGVYSIPVSGGPVTTLYNQSYQKPDAPPGNFLGTFFSPYSTIADGNYVLSQAPGVKLDTSTGVLTRIFRNVGDPLRVVDEPRVEANGNIATFAVPSGYVLNGSIPFSQDAIVAMPYGNTIDIDYDVSGIFDVSSLNVIVSDNTIVPGTASNSRTFEVSTRFMPGRGSPFGDLKISAGTVVFSGAAKPISLPGINNRVLDLWGLYSATSNPGGRVYKLADTQTAIPGGIGKFDESTFTSQFNGYQISNGNVVFWGRGKDSGGIKGTRGLYLSSSTGDKLTKIVAEGDRLVGNDIAVFDNGFTFSLSGNHVLFFSNLGNPYIATLNDNGGGGGNPTVPVPGNPTVPGTPSVPVPVSNPAETPAAFRFAQKRKVKRNAFVVSNAVKIKGIAASTAPISIQNGQYAIGCKKKAFTSLNGVIKNNSTVCIRHRAAKIKKSMVITSLTIGGRSASFTSTTK